MQPLQIIFSNVIIKHEKNAKEKLWDTNYIEKISEKQINHTYTHMKKRKGEKCKW